MFKLTGLPSMGVDHLNLDRYANELQHILSTTSDINEIIAFAKRFSKDKRAMLLLGATKTEKSIINQIQISINEVLEGIDLDEE